MDKSYIFGELLKVLEERKSAAPDKSYVASLYEKGVPKIAQKLGEEAVESVIAAMKYAQDASSENKEEFLKESADLLFHWMVLCSYMDVHPNEVFSILEDRFGLSGMDEKANRS